MKFRGDGNAHERCIKFTHGTKMLTISEAERERESEGMKRGETIATVECIPIQLFVQTET